MELFSNRVSQPEDPFVWDCYSSWRKSLENLGKMLFYCDKPLGRSIHVAYLPHYWMTQTVAKLWRLYFLCILCFYGFQLSLWVFCPLLNAGYSPLTSYQLWFGHPYNCLWGFLGGSAAVKNLLAAQEMWETQVRSLDGEDPLEEEMTTCSSILARKIPWAEEPSALQSIGRKELDMTEWPHTAHNWLFKPEYFQKGKGSL